MCLYIIGPRQLTNFGINRSPQCFTVEVEYESVEHYAQKLLGLLISIHLGNFLSVLVI